MFVSVWLVLLMVWNPCKEQFDLIPNVLKERDIHVLCTENVRVELCLISILGIFP